MSDAEVIHIVSPYIRCDNRLRQRCGWCGAVLLDVDLSRIGMLVEEGEEIPADHPTSGVPVWEIGTFLAVDGGLKWAIEVGPTDPTPIGCCTRLDHDLTGHAPA